MELATISQVTKALGVSTRMLRYYEQIGLLQSQRKEEYAYRVYDAHAVARLQQIIVLRKLRIPLKQIRLIFENPNTQTILNVLMQSLQETEDEMRALSTLWHIHRHLIAELQNASGVSVKTVLLSDEVMRAAMSSLSVTKIHFKEENPMDDLNKANERLSRLQDVRILHLPPCTVAASHYFGENPEEHAGDQLYAFL